MKVIGLTGRERVGKGTVAEMMIGHLREVDCYAKVEGFADRLKVSAARALGFDGDWDECVALCDWLKVNGEVQVLNQTGKLHANLDPVSGRRFLQLYGTEAHREVFGDDFWTDAVLPPTFDREDCDVLIVHDVRFPNEAERVRDYPDGEVWEIVRPGFSDAPASHASQQRIEGDQVIVNNLGLEELCGAVALALEPTVAYFQERQEVLEVPR